MKRGSVDKKSSSRFSHVVLEVGSSLVRGGFAGECVPRFVIPSPFTEALSQSPQEGEVATRIVKESCLRGITSIFLDHLQIRAKDCNVLIIENIFAPAIFRDQLFNVLLNEMQVQSVCFQPDMLMPIISTGCQSGIVIDIANEECRAICIAHGRPLLSTFVASRTGVKHACRRFIRSLNQCISESTVSDNLVAFDRITSAFLFEKTAVAVISSTDLKPLDVSHTDKVSGTTIVVPGWLRHDCLISLIEGDITDEDSCDEIGGILGLILECLDKCSVDVRSAAVKNIVLTGGGAQIPGVIDVICEKLSLLFLHDNISETSPVSVAHVSKLKPLFKSKIFHGCVDTLDSYSTAVSKVMFQHCFPRSSLSWIGGSLFASVKLNRSKYVEREEYLVKTRIKNKKGTKLSDDNNTDKIDDVRIKAPDWLSLNPGDWRFFGTGEYEGPDMKKTPISMTDIGTSLAGIKI